MSYSLPQTIWSVFISISHRLSPAVLVLLTVLSTEVFCSDEIFRIGFSVSTLGEVNQNDAIAAVQIWTNVLATENDIPINPEPVIFSDISQIHSALREKRIDCINVTTPELFTIKNDIDQNYMVAGIKQGSLYEEYVVIVKKNDGYKTIKELRGKSIIQLNTSRTSLAPLWLDMELNNRKLPPMDTFFTKITVVNNLTASVLPVFFNKADACIVTLSGFEAMTELNPQLNQQLTVILQSKPYLPMLFAFRVGYDTPFKEQILRDLEDWHNSAKGRQILTIFQTDSIVKIDYNQLDDSIELIQQHIQQQQ
jgi:ABC-type phosphate/phosphonate transport system substrate-binding protein